MADEQGGLGRRLLGDSEGSRDLRYLSLRLGFEVWGVGFGV